MSPVRLSPEVEGDLSAAVAWFDSQLEPQAANRFLAEFRDAVGIIAAHGHVYRRLPGGFRHLKFKRFSWLVFYRDTDDGFLVVLVVNAARNPSLIQTLLGQRRSAS